MISQPVPPTSRIAFESSQSHLALLETYQRWLTSSSHADWEAFAVASRRPILSAIYRAVIAWTRPSPDLLEDLAQETYVNLCTHNQAALRSIRGETALELVAYLRVVAHHVVQDHFRAKMAEKRGAGKDTIALDDSMPVQTSVEETVERNLLIGRVERCLGGAVARDKAIFWFYFRDGLTAQAISEISGVGLGSKGVESAILRLVRGVRECVKGKFPANTSSQKGATA
jgi:RNA polymerase sigma-70 factor, ECF subfamily